MKYRAGTITWVSNDPHGTKDERPVVVIRHRDRPYSSVECTVMCLGRGSRNHNHSTPELEKETHYTGMTFSKATHLLPWSIHTIPPGAILQHRAQGQLTTAGKKLVVRAFAKMMK
ncbi:MAG: hypothetical protein IH933_00305 [Euryarchaeota archaeon]|jgi:hypothetical protein|nr:hypothetical protein [Euryarchaeota archaeon]